MILKEKFNSIIKSNFVQQKSRMIGIEEESIIYTEDNRRIPVNSRKHFSAVDFLSLLNKKTEANGIYSLEPGGQIEWSSPPFQDLNQLSMAMKSHHSLLYETAAEKDLRILDYGLEPNFLPEEIELIDNKKYQIMDKYLGQNGKMGKWMMRNTSSIQVNLDVTSTRDLEEMVFVADCLHPIAAYLFSNSPFKERKKTGKNNIRSIIWEQTDKKRCGSLVNHGILKRKGLIDRYIEFVLNVQNMFSFNQNRENIESHLTIGEYLKKSNNISNKDIENALHQIFTNVRLKRFVEIRGSDRTPKGFEMAPASFWTGILFDLSTRDEIFNVCSKWTKNDRLLINKSALSLDDKVIGPDGKSFRKWIDWAGGLALEGLKNRRLNEERFFQKFFNEVKKHGPFSLQRQKNVTTHYS